MCPSGLLMGQFGILFATYLGHEHDLPAISAGRSIAREGSPLAILPCALPITSSGGGPLVTDWLSTLCRPSYCSLLGMEWLFKDPRIDPATTNSEQSRNFYCAVTKPCMLVRSVHVLVGLSLAWWLGHPEQSIWNSCFGHFFVGGVCFRAEEKIEKIFLALYSCLQRADIYFLKIRAAGWGFWFCVQDATANGKSGFGIRLATICTRS